MKAMIEQQGSFHWAEAELKIIFKIFWYKDYCLQTFAIDVQAEIREESKVMP